MNDVIKPLMVNSNDLSEMNRAVINKIADYLTDETDVNYSERNGKIKLFPRIIQLALEFEHSADDIPGFNDNDDIYEFAFLIYDDVLNDIREISGIMGIDTWEYISQNEFWMWETKPDSYDFYMDAINCGMIISDNRKLVAKFLVWYAVSETFKKIVELYKGQL